MILKLFIGSDISQKTAKDFYKEHNGHYDIKFIDNIQIEIDEPGENLTNILQDLNL